MFELKLVDCQLPLLHVYQPEELLPMTLFPIEAFQEMQVGQGCPYGFQFTVCDQQ